MNPSVMINGVDYYKCVFIDESCFNIHPRRPARGSSAKARIPMPCNHIFTFLGGITGEGVVSLSARRMPRKSSSIKDKYVGFLEVLMKVLKENGMGGRTLVMDNAPIHKTQEFQEAIIKQGFHIMYLPQHRPFLNPMQEFWLKLNASVNRKLPTVDALLPRVTDSANQISAQDCQRWIKHLLAVME